jgi:hypothetical protein
VAVSYVQGRAFIEITVQCRLRQWAGSWPKTRKISGKVVYIGLTKMTNMHVSVSQMFKPISLLK